MPRTSQERWYKHTVCVSERDREIYDQVAVVGRPQREVAKEFKISQPRVSKIVNRVFAWMCETAPYGYAEVPRPQRLYGVARTYKRKLEWYENEAKSEWLKSKTDEPWSSAHDLVEGPDGKSIVAKPRKLGRKGAKGDVKYLKAGEEFAYKLVHFEGFERNGAVPRHNIDRLFEMPPTIPGEELDDMIAVGHRAAEIKRRQEAAAAESGRGGDMVASATAAPSPRYSGERAGVRGEVGTNSIPATSFESTLQGVNCHVTSHPNPQEGALSPAKPEAGFAREIAEPNDFHQGEYSPAAASLVAVATIAAAVSARRATESSPGRQPWEDGSCDDEARRATEPPAENLSPLPGLRADCPPHPQGSRPGLLSDALRAEGNERHTSDVVKKVYPPTPDGYVRVFDRCIMKMTRRDADDCTKIRLFVTKQPAKYYLLSNDGKEWLPQY